MKTFEILAVLGALAWIYPLAVLLRNILSRTKIEILNHKELEVGFTTNGPIVNMDVAFSSRNKDAFVKSVSIKLEHENKENLELKWEWFEEVLMELDIPDSGIVPYRKNQKAIAIKVPTGTLVEKKIGFQNRKFKSEYSKIFSDTNQKQINISDNDQNIEQLKTSNEYNDFLNLFKNHFPWKKGKYSGVIKVEIAERKKVFTQDFSFELTTLDIKNLELNITTCQKLVEMHFVKLDKEFKTVWKWAQPFDLEK
ncbi:MAG: hypothetical protein ACFHWX_02115 [Bacteroidota bacterium]